MRQIFIANLLITLCFAACIYDVKAQTVGGGSQPKVAQETAAKTEKVQTSIVIKKDAKPLELAQIAQNAHGGDKFKNYKTLVMRGSVNVSTPSFGATQISGTFSMTFSGDKYVLQIQTPFVSFTQSFDGNETSSSYSSVQIPPINRLGLPLLAKVGTSGFVVSALPDSKKRGFRITSPDNYATDFIINEKNGQIKSYSANYNVSGRDVATVVEHDKFREVEGLTLPEKYSQRFEAKGNTFYADFKVKEILVNSTVSDDVFSAQQ